MHGELEVVKEYADSLGLALPPSALEHLDRYLVELLAWGSRVNLVGSMDPQSIAVDHFCDAVAAVAGTSIPSGASIVDIGSGAGLPGIPVAILRPDLRVTLVDAQRKRVAFLEHVRDQVALDYEVIWARAETLASDSHHLDHYTAAFERAVAPLARSVGLVLPLVSAGGLAVFMKGSTASREADEADGRIRSLGGNIETARTYILPGATPKTRTLVLVRKTVRAIS